MRWGALFLLVAVTACLPVRALAGSTKEEIMPGPGDPAPSFALAGSDGKTHALADFAGKQVVVIAWFPKAFTGG